MHLTTLRMTETLRSVFVFWGPLANVEVNRQIVGGEASRNLSG
jgi:hypothetical protein